jgi:shikimate dehydrogenase
MAGFQTDEIMRKFGLIGFPLTHSFSKKYFTEKFEKDGILNCQFDLYEIPDVADFETVLKENPGLEGMSVTIPYKQDVIRLLHELDPACELIGAVNCIQIRNGYRKGFNTDYIGFKESLKNWLGSEIPKALVLGTGGASKAVKVALRDLGVDFLSVSRSPRENQITYDDLKQNPAFLQNFPLIINTTPLGTFPKTEEMPEIPVEMLTASHRVYDLVYNPSETTLMKICLEKGGKVKNGMDMLVLQAEAAWAIWNS